MARLPTPGSDSGQWGDILNEFLTQAHTSNGQIKDSAVTSSALAPNSVTNAALASNAVNAAIIQDGSITEALLDTALQAKVNDTTIADGSVAKAKLATSVQTSLDKADSALQSAPVASVAGKTGTVTLDKSDVGLANVDNTSDANKPISTATQTALDAKANQSTTYTKTEVDTSLSGKANTTHTHAIADVTNLQTSLDLKAPLASPTFTGSVTVPTPTAASQATTKSYVDTGLAGKQNISTAPTGYIRVPGNSKFGTTDFYVMKYQAKDGGSGNAVSVATGTPWVNINQRDAIDKSRAVGTGYHLITEPEWMTIATNILYVDSNWTGGTVGSGQLYRGHSDNNPASALAASTDDGDGYNGTGNDATQAVGSGKEQRRTFTLSNGEVIWDFAGNVHEWTDAWLLGRDQPTVESSDDTAQGNPNFNSRQWTAVNKRIGALGYAVPTNRGWNSSQGLGQLYSRDDTATSNSNTTQYGFIRGGSWGNGAFAGAFALNLYNTPTYTSSTFGFRVSRYI